MAFKKGSGFCACGVKKTRENTTMNGNHFASTCRACARRNALMRRLVTMPDEELIEKITTYEERITLVAEELGRRAQH